MDSPITVTQSPSLGDNVSVFVRVKPNPHGDARKSISSQDATSMVLETRPPRKFCFDWVAGEESTQEEIFQRIGLPLLETCLEGYNATIFAYGQTGSGKTFTLQGGLDACNLPIPSQRGLIPRLLDSLFELIAQKKLENHSSDFVVTCSYLEIYQEKIVDLLAPTPSPLQLREDKKGSVYVENLLKEGVASAQEACAFLDCGAQRRHMKPTAANEQSSRSHSIFTVYLTQSATDKGTKKVKSSRLHLIDLAGSENQKNSQTSGLAFTEGASINKSLVTLGKVIRSVIEVSNGKEEYISYRSSKLTMLLRDSLGGNSKTCIIATVSAHQACLPETMNTLHFAQNAKQIKNRAIINQTSTSMIDLRRELEQVRSQLRLYQESNRPSGPEISGSGNNNLLIQQYMQKEQEYEKQINQFRGKIESLVQLIESKEEVNNAKDMIIKLQASRIERIRRKDDNIPARILDLEQEVIQLRHIIDHHPEVIKFAIENGELRDLVQNYQEMYGEELADLVLQLKKELAEKEETYHRSISSSKNTIHELREALQRTTLVENQLNTQAYEERISGLELALREKESELVIESKLKAQLLSDMEFLKHTVQNHSTAEEASKTLLQEKFKTELKNSELSKQAMMDQQKIENLMLQIEIQNQRINEQNQKIDDLTARTSQGDLLAREHKNEIASLRTTLTTKNLALQEQEKKMSEFNTERKAANGIIQNLTAQSEAQKKQFSALAAACQQFKSSQQQWEAEKLTLVEKMEVAEQKVTKAELRNQQLIEQIESSQAEIESSQAEIDRLAERIQSEAAEVIRKSEELKSAEALHEQLSQQLKQEIEAEKNHVIRKTEENTELAQKLTRKNEELREVQDRVVDREREFETLQETLKKRITELEEHSKFLIRDAELQQEIAQQKSKKLNAIEISMNQMGSKLEEMKGEIENLMAEIQDRNTKFENSESEIVTLKSELERLRNEEAEKNRLAERLQIESAEVLRKSEELKKAELEASTMLMKLEECLEQLECSNQKIQMLQNTIKSVNSWFTQDPSQLPLHEETAPMPVMFELPPIEETISQLGTIQTQVQELKRSHVALEKENKRDKERIEEIEELAASSGGPQIINKYISKINNANKEQQQPNKENSPRLPIFVDLTQDSPAKPRKERFIPPSGAVVVDLCTPEKPLGATTIPPPRPFRERLVLTKNKNPPPSTKIHQTRRKNPLIFHGPQNRQQTEKLHSRAPLLF